MKASSLWQEFKEFALKGSMIDLAIAVVIGKAFGDVVNSLVKNVMMPLIGYDLLQSISLLANGARTFARRCVVGLEADKEKCEANIERSLAMCTALAPVIGYDKAARIAKVAFETNRNVREVAAELSGLSPERLADLLDPRKQV